MNAVRRRFTSVLVGATTLALFVFVGGPSESAASDEPDAGVGESTYGCVESVPKGAERPRVSDTFPPRGTSGWAAVLSVTVRHGKGERVLPSGLDLSSAVEARKVLEQAGFAIPVQDGGAGARLWVEPESQDRADTTTRLELPLVLLPPNPGRNGMVLPPLPVAVARANGEIATVCTHAHAILVEDPIASTPDAEPKHNPPAVPQREEWTALKRALGWLALGLVVGAVLALLLWKWLRRPKPTPPPPPPRPPWEVALEELESVRRAGLLELDRYGEYFDRTSDALRRYLGDRFGFDGLESTTDEILEALKRHGGGFVRVEATSEGTVRPSFAPLPGISLDRVASFLRECDLVKFANLTPTPEQCATSIATGEAIVRATMPVSTSGAAPDPATLENLGDAPAATIAPIASAPATRTRSPYEPPHPSETSTSTLDSIANTSQAGATAATIAKATAAPLATTPAAPARARSPYEPQETNEASASTLHSGANTPEGNDAHDRESARGAPEAAAGGGGAGDDTEGAAPSAPDDADGRSSPPRDPDRGGSP